MRSNSPTPAQLPSPHTPTTAPSLWPWLTPVLAFLRRLWHVSLRSFVRWTAVPRANMAVPVWDWPSACSSLALWAEILRCRVLWGAAQPLLLHCRSVIPLCQRKYEGMQTILIVEDVEFNLDLLVQLLEDDYTILTASDGAAGIALAERTRPDLILMDLSLPVIDGWEATRRIKANALLRSIPIIALTAHAMSGDEEKAKAAGCDDYLSKPIDEDLLYAKLRTLLGDGERA